MAPPIVATTMQWMPGASHRRDRALLEQGLALGLLARAASRRARSRRHCENTLRARRGSARGGTLCDVREEGGEGNAELVRERVGWLFRRFDADRDGVWSEEEAAEAARSCGRTAADHAGWESHCRDEARVAARRTNPKGRRTIGADVARVRLSPHAQWARGGSRSRAGRRRGDAAVRCPSPQADK
eukprot:gene1896-7096_t